jgi:prevent-host-death family protein
MSQAVPNESIRDARQRLAEIVDRAEHEGNPTVITRHGREVAAVVPIEFLREYRVLEESEVLRILNERRAADDGTRYTLEEIMAETLARPE